MSITELFSHERYMAATCSGYTPEAVLNLLDRIEAEVTKTVSELEVQLDTVRDVRDILNLRIAELETAKENYKQMVIEQKQRITEPEADKCTGPDCGKPSKDKQRIAELESLLYEADNLVRNEYDDEIQFHGFARKLLTVRGDA